MAITKIQSSKAQSVNATELTLSWPSATTDGSRHLAFIYQRLNETDVATITPPSGWTSLARFENTEQTSVEIFTTTSSPRSGNETFTWQDTLDAVGILTEYSASDVAIVSSGNSGYGSTPSSGAISSQYQDTVLAAVASAAEDAQTNPSSGFDVVEYMGSENASSGARIQAGLYEDTDAASGNHELTVSVANSRTYSGGALLLRKESVLLSESFEGGAHNDSITTSNTIFTSTVGTAGVFSNNPVVDGGLALRVNANNNISIHNVDIAPQSAMWVSFYLYIASGVSSNTAVSVWRNGTTNVGDIQLLPDNTMRIRDGSVQRWVSTALALGEWHRIAIYIEPGSSTGHRLKIYSGANLHTATASQDSGDQTATNGAVSSVNNIRFGVMSSDVTDMSFDHIRANDTEEPEPFNPRIKVLENFEAGTDQADIGTELTFFRSVFGTSSKFSASPSIDNGLAMRSAMVSQSSRYTHALVQDRAKLWLSFYLYVHDRPAGNTSIAEWRDDADNVIGAVRLMAAGELRLADQFTTRWVGDTLDTDQWHRVAVYIEPDSSNYRLKIYSGVNLHGTTPSQDSGPQEMSLAGDLLISYMSFGVLNATTTDISFDRIQIDDLEEPEPYDGTVFSWSGDGLSAGALTTSSAGTGDDPFSLINGTGLNIVESGSRSPQIELSQSSGQTCDFGWATDKPYTQGAFRFYWTSPSAWPGSSFSIVRVFSSVANSLNINVLVTGAFRVNGVGGTQLAISSVGLIQLNTRYRVECKFTNDSASGTAEVAFFAGDSMVPIETISGTGNTDTEFGNIRFGNTSSSPTVGTQYYDDLALSPEAEFIGSVAPSIAEDFEGGTDGNDISTSTTVFTNIFGGSAKFSNAHSVNGDLSMRVVTNDNTSVNRIDLPIAQNKMWSSFYVYIPGSPSSNTSLFSWSTGITQVVGDVGLLPDNRMRLRDNTIAQWHSTPLTVGEWHRVAVYIEPGSPTGHRMKIYSGADLHGTTASQDSGDQIATGAGATSVDALRFGLLMSTAADVSFDRIRVNDTEEPAPFDTTLVAWSGDGLSAGGLSSSSAGTGDTAPSGVLGTTAPTIDESGMRSPRIKFMASPLNDQSGAYWEYGDQTQASGRVYFEMPASVPPVGQAADILWLRQGSAPVVSIDITSTRRFSLRDDVGVIDQSSTGAWVEEGQYRLEWQLDHGNEEVKVRIFHGESATHFVQLSGSSSGLGATHNRLYLGKLNDSELAAAGYFDDLLVTSTLEYLGPVAGSDAQVLASWNGDDSQPIPTLNTGGLSIVSSGARPPALQADNSGGSRTIAYWDVDTQTTGTARVYFKTPTAWGSNSTKVLDFTSPTWQTEAGFSVAGSGAPGQVRLMKTGGGQAANYSNAVELDTWYRVELMIDQINGRARLYLFEGDSITPILDPGWVNDTFGTSYSRVLVGIDKSTLEQPWLFDDIEVTDSLTLVGPAGDPSVSTIIFSEDFESGSIGADVTTGNTGFDYISPGAGMVFADGGVADSLAMHVDQAESRAVYIHKMGDSIFVRTYIKMGSGSWPNFYMLMASTETIQRANVQLYSYGALIMRDSSGNIGTASPSGLINADGYTRVEWKITATTQRMRVYSGSNLHGDTPNWDSGDVAWTPSGQFDRVTVGNTVDVSGVDAYFDDFALAEGGWIGSSLEPAVYDSVVLLGQTIINNWASSITVNYSSSPGSTLVLFCNSAGENTVTDSAGNTWVMAGDTVAAGSTSQRQGQMYYCLDAAPISSVTISRTGNTNYNISLTEWSGVIGVRDTATVQQPGNEAIEALVGDLIVTGHFSYSGSGTPVPTPVGYTGLTPSVRNNIILSNAYAMAEASLPQVPPWNTGNAGVIHTSFVTIESEVSNTLFSWNGDGGQELPDVNTGGVSIEPGGMRSPVIKVDSTSETRSIVYWDVETQTTGTVRAYFRTPSAWGSNAFSLIIFASGWPNHARFAISGSGQPGQARIINGTGGVEYQSPNGVLELDAWYRVEFMLDQPNNRARYYLYKGDSEYLHHGSGWVTADFGESYDRVRIGVDQSVGTPPPYMLLDDIAGSSLLEQFGPAGVEGAPTHKGWIGGTNQSGQPFEGNSFDKPATAEVGDWMIVTGTWSDHDFAVTDSDGWIDLAEDSRTNSLHSQVWGKMLEEGEEDWTFSTSNGSSVTYTMMWGSGAAAISEWSMGVWMPRSQTGSLVTNVASPGIATPTPNSLVLTISTERTTATEAGIISMAGANEWFFQGHQDGNTQTQSVGYNEVDEAGVSPTVTVTYQNSQNVNGNIVQFALPPSGWSQRDVGSLRGISTANSEGTGTTSLTADLPVEAQVGDVAVVSGNFNTGSGAVITGPTGYAEICNQASNSNTATIGVWYKVLTADDLGQSVTINCNLSRSSAMTVTVWSGVMYDAISTAYIPSGAIRTDASLLSVTPRRNNAILLGIVHCGYTANIAAGASPPLHWETINDNIASGLASNRLSIHTFIRRVPVGERIATLDSNGLVQPASDDGFFPVSAVVALSFMPIGVWNGGQRLSARIVGVWDGSQIVPARLKDIQ